MHRDRSRILSILKRNRTSWQSRSGDGDWLSRSTAMFGCAECILDRSFARPAWLRFTDIRRRASSPVHTVKVRRFLLNGVGAVTRFTYGNRHASPRRTPLLSLWVLLWCDSLAIIPHVCNFEWTRALIFEKSRRCGISHLSQRRFVIICFKISLWECFTVLCTVVVILGERNKLVLLVESYVVSCSQLCTCHCRTENMGTGRWVAKSDDTLIFSAFAVVKRNSRDSYNWSLKGKKNGVE